MLERVEELARHKIGGPALRRTREIAEAWQNGLAEGRRGEFGRAQEQLDRADRLAAGAGSIAAQQAVTAAKIELENRQKGAAPKVEALYNASIRKASGRRSLGGRGAVLASVPEHPAARQARARAWQQIAAIGPAGARWPHRSARAPQAAPVFSPDSEPKGQPGEPAAAAREDIVWLSGNANREAGSQPVVPGPDGNARAGAASPAAGPRRMPGPPRPMARAEAAGPKGRFLLWVDAVGGYLVCLDDRILLGRAGPDSHADIPLMGDLSRNHATLLRNGDGYSLQAHHASFINGKPVVKQAVLHDGDVIRLGSTVELEFRQPSSGQRRHRVLDRQPASASAGG